MSTTPLPTLLLVARAPLPAPVAAALAAAGYEVVTASDPAALAEALGARKFAAAILDADGLGLWRERALAQPSGVPPAVLLVDDGVDGGALPAPPAASAPAADVVPRSAGPSALVDAISRLQEPRPAAPAPSPAPCPPATKRVLIVDDSEMTAKLIEAELAGKGFDILLADSVDTATRMILKRSTRPDLILLDVNMPGVDGVHFCRFIKGNSLFKGIKVLLCSGMDAAQLRATAEACGADGFVPKDSFVSRWVLNEIEAKREG